MVPAERSTPRIRSRRTLLTTSYRCYPAVSDEFPANAWLIDTATMTSLLLFVCALGFSFAQSAQAPVGHEYTAPGPNDGISVDNHEA